MSKKGNIPGVTAPGKEQMNNDISIVNPDKIIQQEDGIIVLIHENEPYVYWLSLYQVLGLQPDHAHQIIKKLTYGKHYISFTRSEIKGEITSIDDLSILPIVKLYHFLTAEGYNRAIMEISTGHMDDPEIAARIEEKKDDIASVYTRYQKGEVLSIALDKANIETPMISGKAAAIVSDCFDIAKAIHEHFGVDKTVATVHLLNGYKPEMVQAGHSGNIEPIVQLLPSPSYDLDEAYLTATAIGSIIGLSNRVVNKLLKDWGYQTEKTRIGSDGRSKPDGWKPTELGFPHGDWKMNSDGHNGGKLYLGVQWRWKASILKVFEERMGLTLNSNQSKLLEMTDHDL